MTNTLDSHNKQLESKILILERENEMLTAKVEENLLLHRAFENINENNDIDNVLVNALESFSVLLNIQFSGIFELKHNYLNCLNSYSLFSNEDIDTVDFSVPKTILKKIVKKETCLLQKDEFLFKHYTFDFKAYQALIIAIKSEIIANKFFVFINDKNSIQLSERLQLFEKMILIISAKFERIYYQNELKKLNDVLEKKVELRTLELKNQNEEYQVLNQEYKRINEELLIAKEKAEESDRLKTAFLQNMTHEIRTPMNAIMGFTSLLTENFEDKSKLEEFTRIITLRCNDLLRLINDILDISKIESGHSSLYIEECNIYDLFAELSLFFRDYQIRTKKEHINFVMQPLHNELNLIFKTDKIKLKQILINLISNAFKFTKTGSVSCYCELKNDKLKFIISDTGIGIPNQKFDYIFERFAQLNNSSTSNSGGTGLGLSIVKGLVGLLGGQVWLESQIDKSSTFYFTIDYNPIEELS